MLIIHEMKCGITLRHFKMFSLQIDIFLSHSNHSLFYKGKLSGVKIWTASHLVFHFQQRLDAFPKLHPTAPPEGRVWDCGFESLLCLSMPDRQVLSVPVRQNFLVADALTSACKVYRHLIHFQHLNMNQAAWRMAGENKISLKLSVPLF